MQYLGFDLTANQKKDFPGKYLIRQDQLPGLKAIVRSGIGYYTWNR